MKKLFEKECNIRKSIVWCCIKSTGKNQKIFIKNKELTVKNSFIYWKYCLKGKTCRDGYVHKHGNTFILSTFTNVSVRGGAYSSIKMMKLQKI